MSDYAYTRALSAAGWAWEFLRRNEDYARDARTNRAGHPVAIAHVSGATLFRLRRRFIAAERWGLSFFADPAKSALETDAFWLPSLSSTVAHCEVAPANVADVDAFSLDHFASQRSVLATPYHEHIAFRHGIRRADLVVTQGTFLFGKRAVTFYHTGLKSGARHAETLRTLSQLTAAQGHGAPPMARTDSKFRDYLLALDGRLEGRSYRDIAEVLVGAERVASTWAGDTLGIKSRVRRAVDCGLALMQGGYRDLL